MKVRGGGLPNLLFETEFSKFVLLMGKGVYLFHFFVLDSLFLLGGEGGKEKKTKEREREREKEKRKKREGEREKRKEKGKERREKRKGKREEKRE